MSQNRAQVNDGESNDEGRRQNHEKKHELGVWYLSGPFYKYQENVKKLASKAGLRIIDADVTTFRGDATPEDQCPQVTLKPEFRPKAPPKEDGSEPVKSGSGGGSQKRT